MQNFMNGGGSGTNWAEGGGQRQEEFQRVFHRLRDLHEVQDESRNELCPVFLDEESMIKTRRESNWSAQQVPTHVNILKELEETAQPHPHDDPTPVSRQRSTYDLRSDQDLRDSNRRLQQDNVKLFNQCIRLRKLLQEGSAHNFNKKPVREAQQQDSLREQENCALKLQVEELRGQNLLLSEQIKSMKVEVSSHQLLLESHERVSAQLEELRLAKQELAGRAAGLQRQLEAAASRSASKSSQSISINNSTQESRRTEIEKDRMITNMKIVHESEKLKLKAVIDELKRELARNPQTPSFSNLVGARKT